MIICSLCDKEAVLMSGHNYCRNHLGLHEVRFFERVAGPRFKNAWGMQDFFMKAFETYTPRLSDLQKWHGRIPRGEWHQHKGGPWHWDMSQDDYIRRIIALFKPIKEVKRESKVQNNNIDVNRRTDGHRRMGIVHTTITAPSESRRRRRGARVSDDSVDV